MKLGLIISMYDEIENSMKTIKNIRNSINTIIVIQSDPGDNNKIPDDSLLNHYELLPDLALSSKNYKEQRKQGGLSTIPAMALSRNCSKGFEISNSFDVDWWIFIMGDVLIQNLDGIKKIINKMEKQNKILAITRPIGQTLFDSNGDLNHIVTANMTTLIPTFFIVKSSAVKKGLFTNILVTNPYASEQCFGDNLKTFLENNKLDFYEYVFFISDEAYPDFIKGLKYNIPPAKTPKFLRPLKNYFNKFRNK